MKTSQRLVWQETDTKENKTFLLMPNEAKEFLDISDLIDTDYAFERITGQTTAGKELITLKVNYFV